MKKTVLVVLAALLIGACDIFPTPANPTPTVTVESPTSAPTQTNTPQPTETSAPVTETVTSTSVLPDLNPTITPSPLENLTTTPATATSGAVTDTATPISFPSTATPSLTPGVRTYGTLPPAVPYNTIKLVNKSKAQAYISLQQQDGMQAILEYPVKGQFWVDVPLGGYIYVAWVGGNKMTGRFRVGANDTIYIFLYKDRVVIEK